MFIGSASTLIGRFLQGFHPNIFHESYIRGGVLVLQDTETLTFEGDA
jgi:hypothetical protein